jgi:ribosomal protein S18 acetylase RimI-like enzyme
MDDLRVRPMTQDEFDVFLARLVKDYAADHVRAGNWSPEEAEERAAQQTAELLPAGLDTPGTLLLVAENAAGEPVGHVWVALERQPGSGGGAFIYDIDVLEAQRGKGYGRALLQAAERETARHGAPSIALNVFGPNTVARRLYESAGYETTSLQMRKSLATNGT